MVEAKEWRGGGRGVDGIGGETSIGGAVCEDRGGSREAVDFYADEGKRCPASKGPWSEFWINVSRVECYCLKRMTRW